MKAFILNLIVLVFCGQTALAQPSGLSATVMLSYNPNQIVTQSGQRLGDLMVALGTAQDANIGTARISTQIRYETATQAGARSSTVAGYPQAITDASLKLGAIDLRLDIPLVRANAFSSKIGLTAINDWFCIDAEHCQMVNLTNAPWGMQGIILDNTRHFLSDETGVTESQSDGFGFQMGRTAARGEFTPALATPQFGTVSVDGFVIGLFSHPTGRLLSGLALPPFSALVGTQEIGRTESWLYLEGDRLLGVIKVEGIVEQIGVLP